MAINIAKLSNAVENYEPSSILEAIGIGRLRELIQRLPVVVDREIEDYEDYFEILDAMNWCDEAQKRHAVRECERLIGFVAAFKLAGDGSDLDTKLVPMPHNPTPHML